MGWLAASRGCSGNRVLRVVGVLGRGVRTYPRESWPDFRVTFSILGGALVGRSLGRLPNVRECLRVALEIRSRVSLGVLRVLSGVGRSDGAQRVYEVLGSLGRDVMAGPSAGLVGVLAVSWGC